MSYLKVGQISDDSRRALIDCVNRHAEWQHSFGETTDYRAWSVKDSEYSLFASLGDVWPRESWRLLLVVRIDPGGNLHRHKDGKTAFTRHHVVLETCDGAVCEHDGAKQHLDLGGIYRMDPSLEHAAWNQGKSRRTHLVVEVDDS